MATSSDIVTIYASSLSDGDTFETKITGCVRGGRVHVGCKNFSLSQVNTIVTGKTVAVKRTVAQNPILNDVVSASKNGQTYTFVIEENIWGEKLAVGLTNTSDRRLLSSLTDDYTDIKVILRGSVRASSKPTTQDITISALALKEGDEVTAIVSATVVSGAVVIGGYHFSKSDLGEVTGILKVNRPKPKLSFRDGDIVDAKFSDVAGTWLITKRDSTWVAIRVDGNGWDLLGTFESHHYYTDHKIKVRAGHKYLGN